MNVRSGAALPDDAATVGAYFLDLISDRSWIRRRVDNVVSVRAGHDEIRSSFDIDLDEVARRAKQHHVKFTSAILVPIDSFEKRTFIDIDVSDASGESIHVLKGAENSFLTHAAFLASVRNAVGDAQMRDTYVDALYRHGFNSRYAPELELELNNLVDRAYQDSPDDAIPIMEPDFFGFDFVVRIPLVAEPVGSSHGLRLIKTRHVVRRERAYTLFRALSALGVAATERQHEIPLRELWGNLHLKIQSPAGMRLTSVDLLPHPELGATVPAEDEEGSTTLLSLDEYQAMLPPPSEYISYSDEMIAYHPRGRDRREHQVLLEAASVRVRYVASITELAPIFFISLAVFGALLTCYQIEVNLSAFSPQSVVTNIINPSGRVIGEWVEKSTNNGSLLALFAILPTFLVLYLTRSSDNFMLARVLQVQRIFVVLSSLTIVVFGGAISIGLVHDDLLNLLDWLLVSSALLLLPSSLALARSLRGIYAVRNLELNLLARWAAWQAARFGVAWHSRGFRGGA